MAKGSLRVNGIIVDTDGEIKASTGDSIVIREDDGSAVITVDTNGKTSIGGPMDVGVDDTGHDVKFFGATAGAYMLWDESQDDLIIGGAGRVGIGTTAPQKHLEISDDGTSGNIPTIRLNSTEPNVGLNDTIGIIDWKSADSSRSGDPVASIKAISNIADGSHTDLLFSTGEDGTAADEKMRITSTGRVGIGTTAPSTLTHINKSSTTAFSASDASWHDLLISNAGTATNHTVGIAFQVSGTNGYAANAGTGIAAVKNGNSSDYGADLVFVTRPQSAIAVERMRITHSGNVGINSTSPSYKLDIVGPGTSGGSTLRLTDSASSAVSWHLYLKRGGSEALIGIQGSVTNDPFVIRRSSGGDGDFFISSTGNVGIGSSSPQKKLTVYGDVTSDFVARFHNDGNSNDRQGIEILCGKDVLSTTNDAYWIRLADGDDNGRSAIYYNSSSPNAYFAAISDGRVKKNIQDTNVNGLDTLNAIKLRSFDFDEKKTKKIGWGQSGSIKLGYIAQEVEEVLPEAITTDADGYKLMGDAPFIPYLIKSVQELSAKNDVLEAEIASLKNTG